MSAVLEKLMSQAVNIEAKKAAIAAEAQRKSDELRQVRDVVSGLIDVPALIKAIDEMFTLFRGARTSAMRARYEKLEEALKSARATLRSISLRSAYLDSVHHANWNRPDRDAFDRPSLDKILTLKVIESEA